MKKQYQRNMERKKKVKAVQEEKKFLIQLIRTGDCIRRYCERSCPVFHVCDSPHTRYTCENRTKEVAAKIFLNRYGEYEIFELLL